MSQGERVKCSTSFQNTTPKKGNREKPALSQNPPSAEGKSLRTSGVPVSGLQGLPGVAAVGVAEAFGLAPQERERGPCGGGRHQTSAVQSADEAGVRGACAAWRSGCGANTPASNSQDAKLIPAHRKVAIDSDMYEHLHIY